jgi:hypothetical protein
VGNLQLDSAKIQRYLEGRFGGSVQVLTLSVLGHEPGAHELKGYGYVCP